MRVKTNKQRSIETIIGLISGNLRVSDLPDRFEIRYTEDETVYLINGKVTDEEVFLTAARKERADGSLVFIRTIGRIDDNAEIYI